MRVADQALRSVGTVFLAAWVFCGCASSGEVFHAKLYAPNTPRAVKRVAVVAWAPENHAPLAPTLAHVASDLVKLRKNYLVYEERALRQQGDLSCPKGVEGLLVVRTLDAEAPPESARMYLSLSLELLRCDDAMLAFRTTRAGTSHSDDASLSEVVDNYRGFVGEQAARYIAPSFSLLQKMVEQLPNPVLSEVDIEEKIELGSATGQPSPWLVELTTHHAAL